MGSLLRSVLSILAGKSSGIVIGLLFTPILVRVISQEQYGIYASILAGFSLFTLLSKGGLFDACRKTVAEAFPATKEISTIASVSLVLSLFYGVIATVSISGLLIGGILPRIYRPYVIVLTVSVVFTNVLSVVRGIFFGIQEEYLGELLQISRRLIYVTIGLFLAYIGYDLWGVFVGYTLAFGIIAVISTIVLYNRFSFSYPTTKDFTTRGRKIATYGAFQLIGGVSAALLYKSDILLVQYFRGSTETALYNSAIVPAEMIWFIPSVIQLAFLQHVANLWTDKDVKQINEDVRTGLKYGTLSLALFGVGLFGLADPFLHVYFGEEYVSAAITLKLLLVGTFFFGLSRITLPVFQAIGWIRVTEFVAVAALVLNLTLNIVLIPRYGILGAGIGTTISYLTIFVGNMAIWSRSPVDFVPLGWYVRLVVVQCSFAAIFLGIVSLSEFSPIVSLLIFPPFGLFLFTGINVSAGFIHLSSLKSIMKGPIERYL